jgi:hypothetical protein
VNRACFMLEVVCEASKFAGVHADGTLLLK